MEIGRYMEIEVNKFIVNSISSIYCSVGSWRAYKDL